jgi:hypothetical protein
MYWLLLGSQNPNAQDHREACGFACRGQYVQDYIKPAPSNFLAGTRFLSFIPSLSTWAINSPQSSTNYIYYIWSASCQPRPPSGLSFESNSPSLLQVLWIFWQRRGLCMRLSRSCRSLSQSAFYRTRRRPANSCCSNIGTRAQISS